MGCSDAAGLRTTARWSFLLAQYAGWTVAWLAGLTVERAHGKRYLRLCQWLIFLLTATLIALGIFR